MLTEELRHKMIDSFKQTNGEDTAMALAESLFSNDLVTKEDLKGVKDELESRMDKLEALMHSQFWKLAGLLVILFGLGVSARIFG